MAEETNISELNDKISQQDVISDMELKLCSLQQTRASLELKISQKDEVIIKSQAQVQESKRQIQALEAEVKKLKDQLKDTSKLIENSSTSELQQALKAAEEKASKALTELHDRIQKDQKMNEILVEYEQSIANHTAEYKKLSDMHETVKGNLATLEMAFHDVIQKYERSKTVIEGYKANEEIFNSNIEAMEKNLKLAHQKYDSLKVHAAKQIEKANKENICLKGQFEALELKQNAIIKRLEIKTASLENALEQKSKECAELAALCDEVTGKKV